MVMGKRSMHHGDAKEKHSNEGCHKYWISEEGNQWVHIHYTYRVNNSVDGSLTIVAGKYAACG